MGFHNPFIKDGLIKFPDNGSLVLSRRTVDQGPWRQARLPVPGLLDRARRCRAGSELGRLRQAQPRRRRPPSAGDRARRPGGDPLPAEPRVPRRLLRHSVLGPHRGAAVRSERAGPRRPAARRPRRLPPVGHPDHHRGRRGRPEVLPQQARQGASARHRRRRGARRCRRHLGARWTSNATPSPTCSTPPVRRASRPACRSPT